MIKRITIKDHKQESRLFNRRLVSVTLFVSLFVLILISRLFYLQVIEHHFYSTLSEQNLLNIIPVQPNRGLIYDRNGILIAKNIPTFNLDLIPGRVHNINTTIQELAKIIPISDAEIKDFRRSLKEHRPYQKVPLKLNISESEVARFYINQYRFPGVTIDSRMMRYYPLGKTLADVVGYVGRINAKELGQVDSSNYSATDYIGKVGIEKYYEKALHGQTGSEEVETDASGRIVRVLKRNPPTPGTKLYLTIDSKLQTFAEKALGDDAGAIVAIQPSTGQILALVTKPTFNPNIFVTGFSEKAYQKLIKSKQHPLYNRTIRGLYSPGSTIKPFYALGGLNQNIITPRYTIYDPGYFRLPNTKHIYHDWKHSGHGWVNLSKAITVSCDVYFYNLAVNMGIKRMDHLLKKFGFGQPTGIDLTEELIGIVPSPQWKKAKQGHPWYTGDTIITGIGQGSLLVTPLQLAFATATLAEHGKRFKPTLLLATQTPGSAIIKQAPEPMASVLLKNPNTWNTVISAMEKVVNSPHGTAIGFGRHPNYTVAAKTGTAQVYGHNRNEEFVRTNIPKRLRNNHLFIAFAPVDHPQIAIAVVVEHASLADRITRQVVDYYFTEQAQLHQKG